MPVTNSSSPHPRYAQSVGFVVEHYDAVARLLKAYVLTYFPDNKLQMVRQRVAVLSPLRFEKTTDSP